jgi:hypothetical protein
MYTLPLVGVLFLFPKKENLTSCMHFLSSNPGRMKEFWFLNNDMPLQLEEVELQ